MDQQLRVQLLGDRNLGQMNILHRCPNDGQTTGFGREGINLIGALPDIAKEALHRVGAANVAMHQQGKRIKGQQMLFIFTETTDRFGRALLVFRFEGC